MSEHIVPTKIYYSVFAALLLMTGITTGVAFIDLGKFNIAVALVIAVFKAVLVVLFFMHVKYSTRLTKMVIASGIFWLMIMLLMTMTDIWTRTWMGVPGR